MKSIVSCINRGHYWYAPASLIPLSNLFHYYFADRFISKNLLALSLLFFGAVSAWGQTTYYSKTSGSWNTAANWSTVSHVGAAAAAFPVAGDIVFIGGSN